LFIRLGNIKRKDEILPKKKKSKLKIQKKNSLKNSKGFSNFTKTMILGKNQRIKYLKNLMKEVKRNPNEREAKRKNLSKSQLKM